jgi:hypothetical protein
LRTFSRKSGNFNPIDNSGTTKNSSLPQAFETRVEAVDHHFLVETIIKERKTSHLRPSPAKWCAG